jgi:hypothetical protein
MGEPAATRPMSGSASCARLQRQRELLEPRLVDGAQRFAVQPDAARGAADQFDDALARQGLQVLFRRVGRLEAELGGDLGPGGRRAGAGDGALDQVQNLLLAGGELGRLSSCAAPGGGITVLISSICIFNSSRKSASGADRIVVLGTGGTIAGRRHRPATTSATRPRSWASNSC